MWVNAALDRYGMGGWVQTNSLVINLDTKHGWAPSRQGDDLGCYTTHAWSPDGRSVAYWHQDADGNDLWLVQVDTLEATRLIAPNPDDPWMVRTTFSYDLNLHWSPDGRSIAFVSAREAHPEVFLLNLR